MEAGESRALLSTDQAISDDGSYVSYQFISNFLESSFRQVYGPPNPEVDSSKLLSQLLDQIVVLGQTAQLLKQYLSDNGHRQNQIAELIQLLAGEEKHAH